MPGSSLVILSTLCTHLALSTVIRSIAGRQAVTQLSNNITLINATYGLPSSDYTNSLFDNPSVPTSGGRVLTQANPSRFQYVVGLGTGDDIEIQVSPCVAKKTQIIGNWTYLNGTNNPQTTWANIWDDAHSQAHYKDSVATGFNYALSRAIELNLNLLQPRVDNLLSQFSCQVGGSTINHDELRRKLLQVVIPFDRVQEAIFNLVLASSGAGVALAAKLSSRDLPANATSLQKLRARGPAVLGSVAVAAFTVYTLNNMFNAQNHARLLAQNLAQVANQIQEDQGAQVQQAAALLAAGGLEIGVDNLVGILAQGVLNGAAAVNADIIAEGTDSSSDPDDKKRRQISQVPCMTDDDWIGVISNASTINDPAQGFFSYTNAQAQILGTC